MRCQRIQHQLQMSRSQRFHHHQKDNIHHHHQHDHHHNQLHLRTLTQAQTLSTLLYQFIKCNLWSQQRAVCLCEQHRFNNPLRIPQGMVRGISAILRSTAEVFEPRISRQVVGPRASLEARSSKFWCAAARQQEMTPLCCLWSMPLVVIHLTWACSGIIPWWAGNQHQFISRAPIVANGARWQNYRYAVFPSGNEGA
jgi:hypothetical protein